MKSRGYIGNDVLLFAVIALAYGLKGAKTPITFFFLFLFGTILFVQRINSARHFSVPKELVLPFFCFFAWCWISLLSSPPLDQFLFVYSRYLLYFLFAMLVALFLSPSGIELFKNGFLFLAVLESLIVVSASLRHQDPQFGGHLANPIHSGVLIPVGFVIAAMEVRVPHCGHWTRWRSVVLMFVFSIAIFLLRSRSALLVIGATALLSLGWKKAAIASAILLFAGVLLIASQQRVRAYLEIDASNMASSLGRFAIWKTGLLGVRARPFLGFGLGNFETLYRKHQQPSGELLRYAKETQFAHNGFLHTAAEAGLPGLLFLLWGLFQLGFSKKEKNLEFPLPQWPLGVAGVFFMTSLFNYSLALPFSGLLFSAAAGIWTQGLLAERSKSLFSLVKWKNIFFVLFIILNVFTLSYAASDFLAKRKRLAEALSICPIRSNIWYESALDHLNQMEHDPTTNAKLYGAVMYELKNALAWNHEEAYYWHRMALVVARYEPNNRALIDLCFRRAKECAPMHAPFYVEEGFYRLSRKQWWEARELFENATNLEPIAPVPYYGLALVNAAEGQHTAEKVNLLRAKERKDMEGKLVQISGENRVLISSPYGSSLFGVDSDVIVKALGK